MPHGSAVPAAAGLERGGAAGGLLPALPGGQDHQGLRGLPAPLRRRRGRPGGAGQGAGRGAGGGGRVEDLLGTW